MSTQIASQESRGRWVLAATILGSSMAFLDSTVVNVALPAIGRDLSADVTGLQWTLNGYLLPLAAFILLGGSLGDRYGRRRVFLIGTMWFGVASLLCATAQTTWMLVAARALQGTGAALLTPGSLAIIQSSFRQQDRGRAIGTWSALSGIAVAIGPLLGGWLVDVASWRAVFLINLPLTIITVAIAARHVPETKDLDNIGPPDIGGAAAGVVGLGGVTFALIEAPNLGWGSTPIIVTGVIGLSALVAFVLVERRTRHPMVPVGIFGSQQFTAANAITFLVYAALAVESFLLVVHLQNSLGYSPFEAGAAIAPIPLILLWLSPRAGELAQRIGPRRPLTVGPATLAVAMLMMVRIAPGVGYMTTVLPAVVVFGLGLGTTVAPVTATVLAAASDRYAGVASGINNAVARAAALLAVAVLPVAAGITGDRYTDPIALTAGFRTAMAITAVLTTLGAVLAWLTISDDVLAVERNEPAT